MQKNEERPRVLLVDDDSDFQSILQGWLSPNYDNIMLSDGENLMDEMAAFNPDLLVLDVNLPGPDGFQLCRRIRDNSRYTDLPILFITGRKEDEAFAENIHSGGTAYITKPVDRKWLLSVVRDLLNSRPS